MTTDNFFWSNNLVARFTCIMYEKMGNLWFEPRPLHIMSLVDLPFPKPYKLNKMGWKRFGMLLCAEGMKMLEEEKHVQCFTWRVF